MARTDAIESKDFVGASGPAALFNLVINVYKKKAQERMLRTGLHVTRDVHCSICNEYVGWSMYVLL